MLKRATSNAVRLKHYRKYAGENRRIAATDLSDLMALKRGFRVEVKKLQKDPPLLSNREAVEMFSGLFNSRVSLIDHKPLRHSEQRNPRRHQTGRQI